MVEHAIDIVHDFDDSCSNFAVFFLCFHQTLTGRGRLSGEILILPSLVRALWPVEMGALTGAGREEAWGADARTGPLFAGAALTGCGRLTGEIFTLPSGVRSLCAVVMGGRGAFFAPGAVALLEAVWTDGALVVAVGGTGFFAGSTRFVAVGGFEGGLAAGSAFGVLGTFFFTPPTADVAAFVVPFAVLLTAVLGCTAVFFTPDPALTGPSAAIEFLTESP